MKQLSIVLLAGLMAAAAPPSPPGRPFVIFVHGRNQLGADTAAMRQEWQATIDSALSAAGAPVLGDGDVRLAWYADVLDPDSDADCALTSNDSVGVGFGAFARALLALVAEDSAGSRDMRSALSDVFYVMDPGKRCAADTRVGALIDSVAATRPVVVVAYSLGSVVTYDHLRTAPPAILARVRLITIGSPLGVPVLRDLLLDDRPVRMPDGLASWVNVYDPADDFASPVDVADSAHVHNRATTGASAMSPHDVRHYLGDPSTIDALKQALRSPS